MQTQPSGSQFPRSEAISLATAWRTLDAERNDPARRLPQIWHCRPPCPLSVFIGKVPARVLRWWAAHVLKVAPGASPSASYRGNDALT